jgi:hypothetical protein
LSDEHADLAGEGAAQSVETFSGLRGTGALRVTRLREGCELIAIAQPVFEIGLVHRDGAGNAGRGSRAQVPIDDEKVRRRQGRDHHHELGDIGHHGLALPTQIGARQQKLEKLRKENQILADRYAAMQLPQRLAERVKELKLGLVPPLRHQIVWISEPPPASPMTNGLPAQLVQLNRKL